MLPFGQLALPPGSPAAHQSVHPFRLPFPLVPVPLTLPRELLYDGVHVDSISADQSQAARQAAVDNFRCGRRPVGQGGAALGWVVNAEGSKMEHSVGQGIACWLERNRSSWRPPSCFTQVWPAALL